MLIIYNKNLIYNEINKYLFLILKINKSARSKYILLIIKDRQNIINTDRFFYISLELISIDFLKK